MNRSHATITDAYTDFATAHGSATPEWSRDDLHSWLFDHDLTAPYATIAIAAAYAYATNQPPPYPDPHDYDDPADYDADLALVQHILAMDAETTPPRSKT